MPHFGTPTQISTSHRWLVALACVAFLSACVTKPKPAAKGGAILPVEAPEVVVAPPPPPPPEPKKMSQALRRQLAELTADLVPKGVEVNETPDLSIKLVIPSDHSFGKGRHRLQPRFGQLLNTLAESLNRHIATVVTVSGHTDTSGSDKVNFPLSKRRAESARDHLVKRGVLAERISVLGWGPDHPMADNTTPKGRAANRRIEILIADR